MPQIPLYQQNVAPTTQIGGAEAPIGAPVAKAIGQLGGTVAQVGASFAEKLNKEESEAQLASYYSDRKKRANAIQQSISTMQDPAEIDAAYKKWRKDEDKIFSETELTSSAQRAAGNNNEMFYTDMDIGAGKIMNQARITAMDNVYVDLIAMAENGESHTLEDGTVLGPRELHEYAWKKREMLVPEVDREKVNKEIKGFNQNQYFRTMSKMARSNFPQFKEEYDASKLTPFQQQEVSRIESEVELRATNKQSQEQDVAYNDLLKQYEDGVLTSTDIDQASEITSQAYGVEYNTLTEDRANILRSMLYNKEIVEESSTQYLQVQKNINNLSKKEFNTGEVDKILRSLYIPQKNGTFMPRFSIDTTNKLLGQINEITGAAQTIDIKRGGGGVSPFTAEAKAVMGEITDTFEVYAANVERRTDVAMGVKQIESLYQTFYQKQAEGDEALRQWADEALKPLKLENAKDKAMRTYAPDVVPDTEALAELKRLRELK